MLKDCVKVLKNKDKISGKEFGYIFLANTTKFQTILSVINTPTYVFAKYFNSILYLLTTDVYTVKNAFDLAKGIINCSHNLLNG